MGTVSIHSPKTPVTKGCNGVAQATLPNVCKVPGPPAPFVPAPLPNIGKSGDSPKGYSKSVKFDGQDVAIQGASFGSMGDAASKGTGGGMVSMNTHGPTKFIGLGAMDVMVEGKRVQLKGDQMLNNCGPSGCPANSATLMGERHGGGKNAKHANQDARDSAQQKWEKAKQKLQDAKRSGATKKDKKEIQKEIDHWKRKMDFTGEHHSQQAKR